MAIRCGATVIPAAAGVAAANGGSPTAAAKAKAKAAMRIANHPRPAVCPSTIARETIHNGADNARPRGRGYHRADRRAAVQAPRPAHPEASPRAARRRRRRPGADRGRAQPAVRTGGDGRARGGPQRHRRARPAVRRVRAPASGSTTATPASSRPSPGSAAWARGPCSPTTRSSSTAGLLAGREVVRTWRA